MPNPSPRPTLHVVAMILAAALALVAAYTAVRSGDVTGAVSQVQRAEVLIEQAADETPLIVEPVTVDTDGAR